MYYLLPIKFHIHRFSPPPIFRLDAAAGVSFKLWWPSAAEAKTAKNLEPTMLMTERRAGATSAMWD